MALSRNELVRFGFSGRTPERRPISPYIVTQLQRGEIPEFARIVNAGIVSLRSSGIACDTERTLDYYQKSLEDPALTFLIARDQQGAVVGGLEAQYVPEGSTGYIHWVGKDPTREIIGVGTALYTEYENILRTSGAEYMYASVHDANVRSLKFHEKFGFNTNEPIFSLGPYKKMKLYYKKIG